MSLSLRDAVAAIDAVIDAAEEIGGIYYKWSRKGQEDRYGADEHFEVEGLRLDLHCSISCSRNYTYKCLRYFIAGERVNLKGVRSLRDLLADIADHGDRATELTVPALRKRAALFPHIYVPAIIHAAATAKGKARRTALLKLAAEYAITVQTPGGAAEILI